MLQSFIKSGCWKAWNHQALLHAKLKSREWRDKPRGRLHHWSNGV